MTHAPTALEHARTRQLPVRAANINGRGGLTLVLCSALCFATLGVLAQLAYRSGVSVATLVSARFLLAAAIFWLLVRIRQRPLPLRRDALFALALGLAYGAQSTLVFAALTHTKAALVDLLFFTYPALVVVGALALRRERWSGQRAGAIAASLLGTAMVLGSGAAGLNPAGAALALAAAVLYAGYILAASALLPRVDALVLVALVTSSAAIAATAGGLSLDQLQWALGGRAIILLAAIALVSTVLGIGSFAAGVARLGPSRASIASSIQPALTALLAFLSFGDRLGPLQLLGGALVLATIVLLERLREPGRTARLAVARAARATEHSQDAGQLHPLRPIVVRLNHASDEPELERLATLESKHLPTDPLLVAEIDGEILAATTIAAPTQTLRHPSRRTAHLVELLELRASQIRHPKRQPPLRLNPSGAPAG